MKEKGARARALDAPETGIHFAQKSAKEEMKDLSPCEATRRFVSSTLSDEPLGSTDLAASRKYDITILGATGFTGRYAAILYHKHLLHARGFPSEIPWGRVLLFIAFPLVGCAVAQPCFPSDFF